MNRKLNRYLHCTWQKILVHRDKNENKKIQYWFCHLFLFYLIYLYIFEAVWGQVRPMVCGRLPWNVLDFGLKSSGLFPIWYCLRPGASHGLRAATMERSGFFAWNLPCCFPFGVVWCQARSMVCGRLPWNVLDLCFLRKHWTTFLTQNDNFSD